MNILKLDSLFNFAWPFFSLQLRKNTWLYVAKCVHIQTGSKLALPFSLSVSSPFYCDSLVATTKEIIKKDEEKMTLGRIALARLPAIRCKIHSLFSAPHSSSSTNRTSPPLSRHVTATHLLFLRISINSFSSLCC